MNIETKTLRSGPERLLLLLLLPLGLSACGGGGDGGGGSSPPPPPPPLPPAPIVRQIDVSMAAGDVASGSTATGSAAAVVDYNVTDGEIEVSVTLANMTAEAVAVKSGYAGEDGEHLFALSPATTSDEWVLDATPLTAADIERLDAGALYLEATTAAFPDGAVRGQIVPAGIELARVNLAPGQVTADGLAGASGMAWVTIDPSSDEITVHLGVSALDDADGAVIRNAIAGSDGPELAQLSQDTVNPSHWMLETTEYTTDMAAAAAAGELYVEVTSPAAPEGAIRGQYLPDGMELVVTDLTTAALVMGTGSSTEALGRAMTTIGPVSVTSHVNLFSIGDADKVDLRRAPAGQNGPVVAGFAQDILDPNRWSLVDQTVDAAFAASLGNQGLYVLVTSPGSPDGAARGQIVIAGSMEPADPSAFVVTSIDPANAATLDSLPSVIRASLNRAPLTATVTPSAVLLEASGQDGSFGDGNEVVVTPSAVTADGNDVVVDLAGVIVDDDVYRLSLFGSGGSAITDENGISLDGDADGQPGGTFESAFEVMQPPVTATFGSIQDTIFTVSCATSGCHSGANPPDGLNLESGTAYSNIVNVPSVQMPVLMRIDPGDPDASYLVRKIEGVDIVASRMPLGNPPLSEADIDRVREWVANGALDN